MRPITIGLIALLLWALVILGFSLGYELASHL